VNEGETGGISKNERAKREMRRRTEVGHPNVRDFMSSSRRRLEGDTVSL